ncbi:MAG: endolytic transglycosylase MltG, partial [Muribaculaceae bacterium]|nr:endolytic transglycosylase MltG [Muribaculaceae bacterium]
RLTSGPQAPLTITINGFRLLPVLEEKVAARFDFTQDSIASVLADAGTLKEYGLTPEQALSLFINDSYQFFWNASPAEVVKKVGAHYDEVWTTERKAKAKALGLSPADVMTLASIVDEESSKLDEKGAIGRLYINRLQRGMKLQADPTVRYAGGDFSVKRIKNPNSVESPYNTYIHMGLPPGPIRTTSVETIDAILDSKPHDYIYMCAKEDFSGYHNFASTYAEHQANARRYKRELDRRGIY